MALFVFPNLIGGDVNDFFTLEYILTFGGATAVVVLVTTVVNLLVGERAKPHLKSIALLTAIAVMLLGAWVSNTRDAATWIMALINGLVVFLAAVGSNQLLADRVTVRMIGESPSRWARLRTSWL